MLAKNAESALAGLGCRLIRQPRQPIDSETEFAKASQGPADEFIVRVQAFKKTKMIAAWARAFKKLRAALNLTVITISHQFIKLVILVTIKTNKLDP